MISDPDAPQTTSPARHPENRTPVLVVRSTVIFPMSATALQVAWPPNVEALSARGEAEPLVAIVPTTEEDPAIAPATLQKIATSARVLDRLNLPGGLLQVTLQGISRVRLEEVRFEEGFYSALAIPASEIPAAPEEADRLIELILTTLDGVAAKVPRIPNEVPRILRNNLADPGRFADLVVMLAHCDLADRDTTLQLLDVTDRIDFVLGRLRRTWERIRKIEEEERIAEGASERGSSRVERKPTDLRSRIRALQAELGEMDPLEREGLEMLRRIDRTRLPLRVAAVARREAERMRTTPATTAEGMELRNYLDTLLSIPWLRTSERPSIDLEAVRQVLDEEHLYLEDVKRRLLEVLSVAKLRGDFLGPIPCLVGPPGVGKRSLAAAVARGLGRPLTRVELGGEGEAELVGTRRSRSGAQPGKLVLALRDAGVRDPVYLLEEVDEIGAGKTEGDPAEALGELLDPEGPTEFVDRYLEVPINPSDALFIALANDFGRIPPRLRERFVAIRIAGYTPEEKVEIARRRFLPQLARDHGLRSDEIEISEETLLFLTRGYARDAGLENLRRVLSALLRSLALEKASGKAERWTLTPQSIEDVLGLPRYTSTPAESAPEIGVVTGLAWTASGGELMFIEALKMPGTGRLIITGLLGDVMRESVDAAFSYVRSRAADLGIPDRTFGEWDIHIHFPVGATPKDGPSAGMAVTLAIASSLADRPVRHDLAFTGEVTLRGRILEIGGVKEKTLAAYRAGLREVVLPTGNQRDLRDVPEDVLLGMDFHTVERMDQVFELALLESGKASDRPGISADGSLGERARDLAAQGKEE